MKPTLAALMIVVCLIGVYGAIDLLERHTEERLAYQRWVADACMPTRAGDSAVIVSDGIQMRCRIYSRNVRGMTPVIVSSAVMEVPQ